MSMYHITNDGPMKCVAKPGNCPVGGNHYGNKADAESTYLESLARANSTFPPRKDEVDLPCAFGLMRVKNGDLSNLKARTALISGLCGSLAVAVHDKTGGTPYFVCYGVEKGETLEDIYRNGDLYTSATHALVESTTKPGTFMDAYGQKTAEDLKEFYGEDIQILPGTREMLVAYSEEGVPEILDKFADSVIELDSRGEGYNYLEFEMDEDSDY